MTAAGANTGTAGVDRSPTRLSAVLAVAAALVAVLAAGLYSWLTLVLGVVGLFGLVGGVLAGRQAAVTAGSVGIFVGVVAAGTDGAPALVLLVGAVAAVVAWDSATNAISLGRQLGREAPTARLELVHATTTAAVGGGAVGLTYGLYALVEGGESLTALVLLVLAVVVIASALR